MLRLLDIANMEFVNMILHLVISCDPCADRHIHTYLIIACISDVLVKNDLKFYFMDICIFFRVVIKERNSIGTL